MTAVANYCRQDSEPYTSFEDHPDSGCSSANNFPSSKCDKLNDCASQLSSFINDHGRSDISGNKYITARQYCYDFVGEPDSSGYRGCRGVAGFCNTVTAASPLNLSNWMWNPWIDQWVKEGSDIAPNMGVMSCGGDIELSEESIADLYPDWDPMEFAGLSFEARFGYLGDINQIWAEPSTTSGHDSQGLLGYDLAPSYTSTGNASRLSSNFMTIFKQGYTGEGGVETSLYSPMSDFHEPTISYDRDSSTGASAVEGAFRGAGKKYNVAFSTMEIAGLRYLYGYPEKYDDEPSYRQAYINDILDEMAAALIGSTAIHVHTFNKLNTPTLTRSDMNVYAQALPDETLNLSTVAAAMLTPDEEAQNTLRSALSSVLGEELGDSTIESGMIVYGAEVSNALIRATELAKAAADLSGRAETGLESDERADVYGYSATEVTWY